ncbi:3-phenylpropionate/cinnamic acid dioxygenase subunit beta [Phenylobacterium sp. J367]|uniref:3-phenylpropionate/cinnamic acid dioxygenase subunit beta n=1 Tax=Phenylobacterium sp. J367 TaxID=2898435 RepID=UPI002150B8BC|nr:3-phenylpropionate/cinnamic acid dioxygenase subunit beta [Phenylobacterium sp. J367]MCR5879613.1 3-phenylpropionate/cinnamic acid dioxygenase subunit beta [Phenylobacterium sp. J367]
MSQAAETNPADMIRSPKAPQFPALPDRDLVFEVEQFLYREARLLDEERYEEWLGLMTEDIHYWMPGMQARYRDDASAGPLIERMAFYDDDLLNLRRRVTRFMHATAWAEDPPTRAVHIINNIEVELTEAEGEYRVYSTFVNCRGRNESEESWLAGRRTDLLRRDAGGALRLARRMICITQTVLLAKNLNVFL